MGFANAQRRLVDRIAKKVAREVADEIAARTPVHSPPSAQGSEATIALDYPPHPRVRYGYDLPAHLELAALFAAGEEEYRQQLNGFALHADRMRQIPVQLSQADCEIPAWVNGWLPGLDGLAIYGFVSERSPRRYVEVGSGNSTKFARRAIRDHGLATTITSIDPAPRAEIDGLCDTVIRSPLEDADLNLFDQLEPGDVVFIDNSHRSFQNSDVTVFFLDVLPKIPKGVLVGIHDICLPFDYPAAWLGRYYSEQYLLAAFLLGGHRGMRIVLPAFHCSVARELTSDLDKVWDEPYFAEVQRHGAAFWMEAT